MLGNMLSLELVAGGSQVHRVSRHARISFREKGQILETDSTGTRENQRPFHHVLEFANVAAPLLAHHGRNGFLVIPRATASELAVVLLHEVLDENGDILRTLSERWNGQVNDVQSIEKVTAEFTCFDRVPQVTIRCSNDPDANLAQTATPDACDCLLLDGTQQNSLTR